MVCNIEMKYLIFVQVFDKQGGKNPGITLSNRKYFLNKFILTKGMEHMKKREQTLNIV